MPLPTLGTALIEVLDALNPIVGPGVLDLTPNQATIHCVVYAGGKVGADGAVAEAAGYPLALAQQYPIRQITTEEVSNSGGLYEHGNIVIDNIPPRYSDSVTGRSGGYTLLQLSPRATSNGTDVYYEITGDHAGFYKVKGIITDQRLTWSVVLTRTATRPMVTTPALAVTLTSVAPNVGSAAGGTIVTITGSGFTNATSLLFGGAPVTSFTITSDTQISCVTSPTSSSLNIPVTVIAGSGTFATKVNAFNVLPAGFTSLHHADYGVSLIGGGAASWADLSGNGNTASQSVPTNRPTLGAAINGRATLHFNPAASQSMTLAAYTSGLTSMEFFCLAINSDDGSTLSSPFTFTSDGQVGLLPLTDRKIYDNTGSASARFATGFAPPVGAWSSPWLYNVVSTSSEWTMQFNGVQRYTTASNVFGYSNRIIGSSPTTFMAGDIRIILVYPGKLSVADHALVTSYLKAEGGIP